MSLISAIATEVGAVVEIAEGIQKIGKMLDGERSVVLIFENNTTLRLEKAGDDQDHGGFAATPLNVVKPKQAQIFGAQSKGFMTGVKGRLTYRLKREESPELFVDIVWNNPFAGNNEAGAMVYFRGPTLPGGVPGMLVPTFDEYRVLVTYGAGDKQVEMRYTLLRA